MYEYLRILELRLQAIRSLLSSLEDSVRPSDKAFYSSALIALVNMTFRDVIFYFEQCTLYQRNLRRKNNPMSNLKTNKNGKK